MYFYISYGVFNKIISDHESFKIIIYPYFKNHLEGASRLINYNHPNNLFMESQLSQVTRLAMIQNDCSISRFHDSSPKIPITTKRSKDLNCQLCHTTRKIYYYIELDVPEWLRIKNQFWIHALFKKNCIYLSLTSNARENLNWYGFIQSFFAYDVFAWG